MKTRLKMSEQQQLTAHLDKIEPDEYLKEKKRADELETKVEELKIELRECLKLHDKITETVIEYLKEKKRADDAEIRIKELETKVKKLELELKEWLRVNETCKAIELELYGVDRPAP